MSILVTGANGFVGRAVCEYLSELGYHVWAMVRRNTVEPFLGKNIEVLSGYDLENLPLESLCLKGIEVVVHCAARVHVMKESVVDPLSAFRAVNVKGTQQLAEASARAGVKQFIFLSSIKVNGESTPIDRPFTEDDKPNPVDAYAISKWEAEQWLGEYCSHHKMSYVSLRLPLVYGEGVKGNLAQLEKAISGRVPLPFGCIKNARSLISLVSLCELLGKIIQKSEASGLFLVADKHPLSTPELIRFLAKGLDKSVYLLPIPESILKMGLALLGRQAILHRLCGSLVVDSSKAQKTFDW